MPDYLHRLIEVLEADGQAGLVTVVGPEGACQAPGWRWLVRSNGAVEGAMGVEPVSGIAALCAPGAALGLVTMVPPVGDAGSMGLPPGQSLEVFTEQIYAAPSLLIAGGGHIAQPLCTIGSLLGFQVTVIDDRPEFVEASRFPLAYRLVAGDYSDVLSRLPVAPSTYVVIVTRGHACDYQALRKALERPAAYIGMIGSRRKVEAVFEQLRATGVPEEAINSVHAPIGLDIGAETPAEIALCILAEITHIHHRGGRHPSAMSAADSPLPPGASGHGDVLGFLQQVQQRARQEPLAIATVIATEGSTPRRPGARMAVTATGETLGMVGGGPGEAAAIQAAKEVLVTGRPRRLRLELWEKAAPDLGAVCGGVMELFVEPLT